MLETIGFIVVVAAAYFFVYRPMDARIKALEEVAPIAAPVVPPTKSASRIADDAVAAHEQRFHKK